MVTKAQFIVTLTLLAKYSPPQSVQDDLDCKAQIAEAFDKRDRLLDVGRTLFDVREYQLLTIITTVFRISLYILTAKYICLDYT